MWKEMEIVFSVFRFRWLFCDVCFLGAMETNKLTPLGMLRTPLIGEAGSPSNPRWHNAVMFVGGLVVAPHDAAEALLAS